MKDNQTTPARVKVSASKLYTLADIENLACEFINEQERSGAYPTGLQLVLSLYLAWIGKKEREGND